MATGFSELSVTEKRKFIRETFPSFTLVKEGVKSFTLSVCALGSHIQRDKQFIDQCNQVHILEISLPVPYLHESPIAYNDLGLPTYKNVYSSADICQILKIRQDTFRARVRAGMYPKPTHFISGYWRFTLEEIRNILRLTDQLKAQGKVNR
nr:hypothetical protein [uncultured Desulfobulbus sp.]